MNAERTAQPTALGPPASGLHRDRPRPEPLTEQAALPPRRTASPSKWLETAFVTLAPLTVLGLLRSEDPFFVTSRFPWLVLAPLLAGLRYGFACGLVSALALTAAMGLSGFVGLSPWPDIGRVAGTLVVGMVAGEFADRWLRRWQEIEILARHHRDRLERFARSYHLLKLSHARLEARTADSATSLRGALVTLHQRVAQSKIVGLADLGTEITDLFAQHGWVHVVGLHEVKHGRIVSVPAAQLGEARPMNPNEPIVQSVISTRSLVTARDVVDGSGPLAAIPLEDIDRTLRGILIVHEMPFMAFTHEHLNLLAVLGAHAADLLRLAETVARSEGSLERDFVARLQQAHDHLRRFGLPTSLVAISIGPPGVRAGVDGALEETRRGLDEVWRHARDDGSVVLFVLMPLTDADGLEGYENRVRSLLRERFADTLDREEIVIRSRALAAHPAPDVQLQALGMACGLHR